MNAAGFATGNIINTANINTQSTVIIRIHNKIVDTGKADIDCSAFCLGSRFKIGIDIQTVRRMIFDLQYCRRFSRIFGLCRRTVIKAQKRNTYIVYFTFCHNTFLIISYIFSGVYGCSAFIVDG